MFCPFCELKKREIIKNGKKVLVILSDPRLMPGHFLVIPKRHVEKLAELDKAEKRELLETVIEFEEKILTKLAPGCDMRSNCRPFLKESRFKVNHLHVHLLPRTYKDELYLKGEHCHDKLFKKLRKGEIKKIKKLIK